MVLKGDAMKVELFKNNNFGNIRVVKDDSGEPWFVASDVCNILGLSNVTETLKRVDEIDLNSVQLNLGQKPMKVINESGLYQIVFMSKKPQARDFKRWVTSEVLPSIRKNGMYAVDELLENPELLIQVATKLKIEKERNRKLEKTIEKQKQQVSFIKTLAKSDGNLLIRDFAKVLSDKNNVTIGQNKLFELLREKKILMKDNMPYQRFVDNGMFVVVETIVEREHGSHVYLTTKITPKGQAVLGPKIINHLKNNEFIDNVVKVEDKNGNAEASVKPLDNKELTPKEVEEKYGISVGSQYQHRKRGLPYHIKGIKVIFYYEDELIDWYLNKGKLSKKIKNKILERTNK